METPDKPPPYGFSSGNPSSPPMTPGTRSQSHPRFPPQTSHTSPIYKRMGLSMLAQSPPLEFIQPIGQGPTFNFTRPPSRDCSSRPSTASDRACATTPLESEDEEESEEEEIVIVRQIFRRVEHADFVLEEYYSDPGYDGEIEILRPDQYEDARSERSVGKPEQNGLLDKFKDLHCEPDSSDEEEQRRIYRKKKKRWSAGIFKRTHSQSVEGDSSYSDNDPLDDVDSSARRLRRRVRGPGDRAPLIFEDNGRPNTHNIIEVEEPDDGVPHSQGPPSIPSDDAFTLDELPFWVAEDWEMAEVESDSE
ncbi:hypothetical protein P154DRAFT_626 [Amniculicola lignicola CBS 123094]|uniref:Uncharacterized protein n=1 Tax=Amniculicola lignicola CBS 123094 TaxID=1392246 RepID=A0A6A5X458_9PLEO|nr:hypothetical protein P154DRAFT_626 [Amniculicola lignicola CBS 123094]